MTSFPKAWHIPSLLWGIAEARRKLRWIGIG